MYVVVVVVVVDVVLCVLLCFVMLAYRDYGAALYYMNACITILRNCTSTCVVL